MADKKITDLTALTGVDVADLVEIVDDVAGTPTSKKVTVQNLLDAPHGALTASLPVFTDADKKLASVAVATAFATIKQAATDAATGVVELATDAETITGSDTTRAVTPANITAKIDTDGALTANSDTMVVSQKATKTYADLKLAKASNLSDVANASTAFGNIKQAATDAATGVVELATAAECLAFADTSLVVTVANAGKCNTVRHAGSGSITAAQMRGHTHVVTGAATITLPTVAPGLHAKFVTIGAIAVSVKAAPNDKITLKNTALDDEDKVTNNSTDGDMIEIMANAAGDDWETGIWAGTWTDGGA